MRDEDLEMRKINRMPNYWSSLVSNGVAASHQITASGATGHLEQWILLLAWDISPTPTLDLNDLQQEI